MSEVIVSDEKAVAAKEAAEEEANRPWVATFQLRVPAALTPQEALFNLQARLTEDEAGSLRAAMEDDTAGHWTHTADNGVSRCFMFEAYAWIEILPMSVVRETLEKQSRKQILLPQPGTVIKPN